MQDIDYYVINVDGSRKIHESKIKKFDLEYSNILIVEGRDDYDFICEIISYVFSEGNISGFNDAFQVVILNGRKKLVKFLESIEAKDRTVSILKKIGIILDMDKLDLDQQRNRLENLGFTELNWQSSSSLIDWSNGTPSICFYFFPNNHSNGELEDLLLSSIISNRRMECVDDFMNCVNKIEEPLKPSKSKLRAFCASLRKTTPWIKELIKHGYINIESDVYAEIKEFVKQAIMV